MLLWGKNHILLRPRFHVDEMTPTLTEPSPATNIIGRLEVYEWLDTQLVCNHSDEEREKR